jgi:hypothetical protein
VRHSTLAKRASAGALVTGLIVSGIATAAPVGAAESMKTELHKLRICESGDNFHENTGNGYYGAYQFSRRTWHGLGFHGRPDLAPARRQTHAAKILHHQSGWGSWPSCSQTEHLR